MHTPGSPEAWRAMCQGEFCSTPTQPPCYDRPDYDPPWAPGCPHWKPGGNALTQRLNWGHNGLRISWASCEGCRQKGIS